MTSNSMSNAFGAVLGDKRGIAETKMTSRDTEALSAFLTLAESDGEHLWSRMFDSRLLLWYERELLGSVEVAENAEGRLSASKLVLSLREDLSEAAQRTRAEVACLASLFGVTLAHAGQSLGRELTVAVVATGQSGARRRGSGAHAGSMRAIGGHRLAL